MIRFLLSAMLFALGAMLMLNIGRAHSFLLMGATRNPIAIAVTGFVYENAPTAIYSFEQDIQVHYPLSPYFLLAGIVMASTSKTRIAKYGVFLPIGFAVSFCILAYWMTFTWDVTTWTVALPDMFAVWCQPLIYLCGIGIGVLLRRMRFPRMSKADFLLGATIGCVMFYAIVYRPFLLIEAMLLLTFALLAYRIWPNTFYEEFKADEPSHASERR